MEFNYITHSGIALDDHGNEVRDEDGAIIVVPEDDRVNYSSMYNNGLTEYIVIVQENTDEMGRWSFHCDAEDANHAEEQALDHDDVISCIAVYERIR
jgi:hypothetical protein